MDISKMEKIAEAIAGAGDTSTNQTFRFGDVVSLGGDTVNVLINGSVIPTVNLCSPFVGARVLIAIQGETWMCLATVGGGCPYGIADLYITTSATNPSVKWPGTTWQAYGAGRVLVGLTTSDTDFNTVGKTGGEKNVTLTANQIPSHEGHSWVGSGSNPPYEGNAYGLYLSTGAMSSYGSNSRGWHNYNGEYLPESRNLGGGGSHNNMPPYITVYMWRRTA